MVDHSLQLQVILLLTFVSTLLADVYDIMPGLGEEEVTYQDPSCNSSLPQIWQYGYDDVANVTFLSKEGRFPSYVGYPCSVEMYKEFRLRFLDRLLNCPFEDGVEEDFETYKIDILWNMTNAKSEKQDRLVFQYVCLSQQLEECVEVEERSKFENGTCDGECRCMQIQLQNFPTGLDRVKHSPNQTLQNDVRCGVMAGGVCIPKWSPQCRSNQTIEKMYKPTDFTLQCEANAGCNLKTGLCECAIGHSCQGGTEGFHTKTGRLPEVLSIVVLLFTLF